MGTPRKRRTVMDDIEQSNAATERITEVNRKRKVKEPLGAEGAAPKAKRVRKTRTSALTAVLGVEPIQKPPSKRNKGEAPAAEQAPKAEGTVDAGASEAPAVPANVIESAERFNEATEERTAADVVPTTTPATTVKVTVAAPPFTPDEIAAARKAAEAARKNPEKPLMGEWHGVRWERQLYVGAAVIMLLSSHDKVTAKDMALVIPEEVMPYRELCWVLDDLGKAAQLAENMILKVGRATYSRPPA
jgi:hypothetical protein